MIRDRERNYLSEERKDIGVIHIRDPHSSNHPSIVERSGEENLSSFSGDVRVSEELMSDEDED